MTNEINDLYSLKDFPVDKLTLDICKRAFKNNSLNFRYIPEQFKTLYMVKKLSKLIQITLGMYQRNC